jgi:hypothetical protein
MLIEACEAIERNEDVLKATKSKEEASQIKHSVKFFSAKANFSLGENQMQNNITKDPSDHGNNLSHCTADFWTLINHSNLWAESPNFHLLRTLFKCD